MALPEHVIIKAKCECGKEQRVLTLGSHKCVCCGKSFTVQPKRKPSRITYCNDTRILNRSSR